MKTVRLKKLLNLFMFKRVTNSTQILVKCLKTLCVHWEILVIGTKIRGLKY